jgi:aspartokinase-like uncharacterized kinase
MNEPLWIVKVGGSLLELSNLGERLRRWLDQEAPPHTALVMGGGPTADLLRRLDQQHGLGEERAHWLALRALSLNSHVLANLVARTRVVADWSSCRQAWSEGMTPILDPLLFIQADEGQPQALPHRWDVTTDSVAARLTEVLEAPTLVLLKSCAASQGTGPADWARLGLVDRWFPTAVARLKEVLFVNFREGAWMASARRETAS